MSAHLLRVWLCVSAAALVCACVHAQSAPESGSEAADRVAQLRLDLRFRYAYIEESNKPLRTTAPTLRTVLGAEVKFAPELSATMELIHTDFIGSKRFNDNPVAFASPYPLLPDPRYTDSNELFAKWTPSPDWAMKLGRQRVKLGNERHVSDDDFRNLPQLLDGVSLIGAPLDRMQLTFGQFNRLRTRLASSEPTRLTIAELATNPFEAMSASVYAIRHRPQVQSFDAARFGVADRSNWVFGAVIDGSYPITNFTGHYTFEVARQRATASGSEAVRANYWRGGLGLGYGGLILRADHERRGSNGGRYGFQMPLTNQYAFNGNALQFFDTPREGVRDTWLTMKWERGAWSILNELHWFRSDVNSNRFGRELDVNLNYTINPRTYLRAQWAHYRRASQARGIDVDKVWLTVGYQLK